MKKTLITKQYNKKICGIKIYKKHFYIRSFFIIYYYTEITVKNVKKNNTKLQTIK